MRLTTAKYYTPKGISIQNTGITPDIVVTSKGNEESDLQPVQREKDLRNHLENDVLNRKDIETIDISKEILESADVQLTVAMNYLKEASKYLDLSNSVNTFIAKNSFSEEKIIPPQISFTADLIETEKNSILEGGEVIK